MMLQFLSPALGAAMAEFCRGTDVLRVVAPSLGATVPSIIIVFDMTGVSIAVVVCVLVGASLRLVSGCLC